MNSPDKTLVKKALFTEFNLKFQATFCFCVIQIKQINNML